MLLTIHNYYSKVIQSLRHDKTALVRVFDSRPFRVRVRIATWTSGRAAIHLALAPEADSFMPLRRARWDRVFEGPIVSTFKTIVGSFLDPSRAGGSVTVRFSTHRIKSDDRRRHVHLNRYPPNSHPTERPISKPPSLIICKHSFPGRRRYQHQSPGACQPHRTGKRHSLPPVCAQPDDIR
jgi:hypothetical protein